MKTANHKLNLALMTLILFVGSYVNAQEKKTRPEPPGPDPSPTKKAEPKTTAPKKATPKKADPMPAKSTAAKKDDKTKKAATPKRTGNWYIRQSPALLKTLEPVSQSSKGMTVKVLGDKTIRSKTAERQVSLGTVVDTAGFIITKASEIKDIAKSLKVEINGKKIPAKIFGIHERSDIAMLKIEPAGLELKNVEWQNQTPEVGHFLATPDADAKTIGFGVLSVASREERDTRGFMGVNLQDPGDDKKGSRVTAITPNSPAAMAGMKIGDLIMRVNGTDVKNTQDLIKKVQKQKAGETVKIKFVRDNKEVEKSIKLADRAGLGITRPLNPQETIAGNKLSGRRTGFDRVIQHDTVLKPEHMGGPILDLQGRAIGINIAKNGRVSTYALPLSVIQPAIAELRSGKLDPSVVFKPRLDYLTRLISEKEKSVRDAKLKETADEAAEKLATAKKAMEEAEKEYAKLQKQLEEAGKKKFRAEDDHKKKHMENRSASRAFDNAKKDIDKLKKEKADLESTFK